MDTRSELVETIGKIMWDAEKKTMTSTYAVLTHIVNYIENEPTVEKTRLLSLLRNITSNIQMLVHYRSDEDGDETMVGEHTPTNE
jgi:hypothetical protein